MGQQITDYFLYKWRYILGYGFIGISVVALFILAGLFIPGGITQSEMNSAVMSKAISFSPDTFNAESIINLPFHLLQRASMWAFGVTNFSIKFPAMLLALFSALGMLLLLRTWFKRNVAVLTTILVITTGQFLFIAQNGTPSIMYVFTSVWLLFAAMMISRRARFSGVWKLVLFGIAATSLYTPLSIYVLIALASATLLHPHLRFLVRRLSKVKLFFGTLFFLVLLAPLGYAIIKHPDIGLRLLGIPEVWPDFGANALQLVKQYFDFISSSSTVPMTPVYGLGSIILIGLGVYRLTTTKYTARSYIITIWSILLLPALLLNPNYTSVTFIPVLLLMAMGISTLLTSWYRLFPRNPYARFAGLIPLALLVSGMVLSGVDRYMYGYLYNPAVRANFTNDLSLINKELRRQKGAPVTLAVDTSESAFYAVVAKEYKNVTLTTTPPPTTSSVIVTHAMYKKAKSASEPTRIITDARAKDADRFYIYKTDVK